MLTKARRGLEDYSSRRTAIEDGLMKGRCVCARSSQPTQPAHPGRPLIPAYGSGGFLSSSSPLARLCHSFTSKHQVEQNEMSQLNQTRPPPSTQHRSLATSPPFSSKKSVSNIATWDHLNRDCSIWDPLVCDFQFWDPIVCDFCKKGGVSFVSGGSKNVSLVPFFKSASQNQCF